MRLEDVLCDWIGLCFFFFQAEDGIRDLTVTGVQTCALPIYHVTKAYGDRVLIDDLSFKLPRGGIVGVVGPDRAGKTTPFRMIVGPEKPDPGTLTVGATLKLAYLDHTPDPLDPDKTGWKEIQAGA